MADTIFYTNVSEDVRSEVDLRIKEINTQQRAESLGWSYQRMLQVRVKSGEAGILPSDENPGRADDFSTGKGLSLAPPPNGGFEDLYRKGSYRPIPILNSVKISQEGRFGSLQNANVSFTVFTFDDLDKYEEEFMRPGVPIQVKYKWTRSASGRAKAVADTFQGIVSNFNYSLNPDGSFACTLDAVGEGAMLAELNVGQSKTDGTEDKTSEDSTVKSEVSELISNMKSETNFKNIKAKHRKSFTAENGYVYYAYYTTLLHENQDDTDSASNQTQPYVSLYRIVDGINTMVGTRFNILCNRDVTLGHYSGMIASTDPSKIVIPDEFCGNYLKWDWDDTSVVSAVNAELKSLLNKKGVKDGFNYTPESGVEYTSYAGKVVSSILPNILINISEIDKIFNDNPKITVKSLLTAIFTLIDENTGGFHKLTLLNDSSNTKYDGTTPEFDSESGNLTDIIKLRIVDTNYAVPTSEIKALRIGAKGKSSILKSMNLSSKLPSGVAATAYAATRGRADLATEGKSINDLVGYDSKKAPKELIDKITKQLIECQKNIGINGYKVCIRGEEKSGESLDHTQIISSLKNAMQEYIRLNDTGNWQQDVLYPFELSFTMDGIAGFKFGNVIETNWLPSRFLTENGVPKLVFTVTTVEHNFSGNEWTTTVNTVCRTNVSI